MYNLIGFILLAAFALLMASAFGRRPGQWFPAQLLMAAVALRILGSTARYEIIYRVYRGLGDAILYYQHGLEFRRQFLNFETSPFSLSYWAEGPNWWGTSFMDRLSGVAVSMIGPTMRGEFLFFSLVSFIGLYLIAASFREVQPGAAAVDYTRWMWVWPSLWFWPASVGKESVILLAIGLTVRGYVGRRGHVNWFVFAMGLGLSFCLRPHVAAVLACSAVIARWLGGGEKVTPRRIIEGIIILPIAILALIGMFRQFGLEQVDLEGISEFVQYRSGQTLQGGSNIGAAGFGPLGVPIAFINVWMRPFPWDVHNMTSLFAAVEMALLWWLIWQRRNAVKLALRSWRKHRLLCFALPFLVAYTLLIGMAFGNLGLIARQRSPVFPFVLMLCFVAPNRPVPRRRKRRWQPAPAHHSAVGRRKNWGASQW